MSRGAPGIAMHANILPWSPASMVSPAIAASSSFACKRAHPSTGRHSQQRLHSVAVHGITSEPAKQLTAGHCGAAQFLNDWQAKLWSRFFCLSVYVTMYLNDHQRSAFYESIGLNTTQFNRRAAERLLGMCCVLSVPCLPPSNCGSTGPVPVLQRPRPWLGGCACTCAVAGMRWLPSLAALCSSSCMMSGSVLCWLPWGPAAPLVVVESLSGSCGGLRSAAAPVQACDH